MAESVAQMMILGGSALLVFGASWALLHPFFSEGGEQQEEAAPSTLPQKELLERKERLLRELEELEYDHQTRKINATDYQQVRVRLMKQAAKVYQELHAE